MSYLGRSGSADGEGQTVLGGGGGGAGGALSFPFSWQAELVLLVGVGRDPVEECVVCCGRPGHWGGKAAWGADRRREAMSRRDAWSGARFGGCGMRSGIAT